MKIILIFLVCYFYCIPLFSIESYIVKKGDFISKISKRYDISPHKIGEWNNIQNLDQIKEGQLLFLEEPSLYDIYREKVIPLEKKIKDFETKKQLKQNNNQVLEEKVLLLQIGIISLSLLFFIFLFLLRKHKKRKPQKPNTDGIDQIYARLVELQQEQKNQSQIINQALPTESLVQQIKETLKNTDKPQEIDLSSIHNAIQQLETPLVDIKQQLGEKNTLQSDVIQHLEQKLKEIPDKFDQILSQYEQQMGFKEATTAFLVKEWKNCKANLTSLKIIKDDLNKLEQHLIQPIEKNHQFAQNQSYVISQGMAELEEILYWHYWLALPLDENDINYLASLIALSKLIVLQHHYYIHLYPFEMPKHNPPIDQAHLAQKLEKIATLCPKADLSHLILNNILDLLFLFQKVESENKNISPVIQLIENEIIKCPNHKVKQKKQYCRILSFKHLTISHIKNMKRIREVQTTEVVYNRSHNLNL